MFFSDKKSEKEVAMLNAEIKLLETKCKTLERQLKEQQEKNITAERDYDADVYFNFSKLDVFSIERVPAECDKNAELASTVIGFFVQDGNGTKKTKEWVLYCSLRQHNILVDKLNKQF